MEDNEGRAKSGDPRRYEPPAVVWEEVFDPYVFRVCGKMVGTVACNANMKS